MGIAGPIYILSRIVNVFSPLFLVLYLNANGINAFIDLDIFQVVMLCSYILLLSIWFILAVFNIRDAFIFWHILPSTGNLHAARHNTQQNRMIADKMKETYLEMTLYPIVEQILVKRFGTDICDIVMNYYENMKLIPSQQVDV